MKIRNGMEKQNECTMTLLQFHVSLMESWYLLNMPFKLIGISRRAHGGIMKARQSSSLPCQFRGSLVAAHLRDGEAVIVPSLSRAIPWPPIPAQ